MEKPRTYAELKQQIDEYAVQHNGYDGALHFNIDRLTAEQMINMLKEKSALLDTEVVGTRMTLEECIKSALYVSLLV